MKKMREISRRWCGGSTLVVYGWGRPDPAPWDATVSSENYVSIRFATTLNRKPRLLSPTRLIAATRSRFFRFAVFLAIIGGFTALLSQSPHALFNTILALGVAGVVSASWKFSA